MLLRIDPAEPESWLIGRVAQILRRGGLAVVPTDTVYAIVCLLSNEAGVERLVDVKRVTPATRLSILVPDIATAARFARGIGNRVFRAMRRVLPGPYTFIFLASGEVPRVMLKKRRTVGLRIPDNPTIQALLAELDEPLFATSVRNAQDELLLDPVAIEDDLRGRIEVVIDAGLVANEPSTVIDVSADEPVLVRAGKGPIGELELFS